MRLECSVEHANEDIFELKPQKNIDSIRLDLSDECILCDYTYTWQSLRMELIFCAAKKNGAEKHKRQHGVKIITAKQFDAKS